jgi:ribosomal-protein-alanine N-acetyltransferase
MYRPFPSEFPVLSAEGITLRELTEDDLPAWFERLADREAAALAGDPVATSMDVVVDGLAHHRRAFQERTGLRWAIAPDDLPVSVGSIGFVGLDSERRTAEVGAAIGRAHWGQRIASRAAHQVIEYGFSQLELHAIEAVVLPENGRTLRVLAKFGFEPSGTPCPGDRAISGRADSLFYALERKAWAAGS